MSESVAESTVEVDGRAVRYLARGAGDDVVLMLHTGVPGQSAFAPSADLLADLMGALDLPIGRRLLAPDLPGAGATALRGVEDLTAAGVAAFADGFLAAVGGAGNVQLVAHGESSLAALALTREGFSDGGGATVASCFLIAPNAAAPIGDSIQNVSLLHPPVPRYSERSQRWALRRLAYVPDRVPEALLSRLVANADGAPHAAAVELLADPVNASALLGLQIEAMDAFYAYCRDVKYSQPITVIWGAQDPTASVARGGVLAEILGGGPASLDFQLVNRCGHLAQFDRPFQLARVLDTALARTAVAASAPAPATTA